MKVVHIVENLHTGAVENWLVRMLSHARRLNRQIEWTFYCAVGRKGQLDREARDLGASVIHSPVPIGQTRAFVRSLRHELRRGCYDVLHCHHDLVSAVYLVAAAGLPIRKRLIHAHNPDEGVPTPNPIKQSVLRPFMRRTCLSLSDGIIGNSNHTLDTFLAGRERRESRDVVHYYGVDPALFGSATMTRADLRRGLGLPANARILLFAGRVVPEKNPVFVVEVLARLRSLDPTVAGVFVGSGSLDDAVRKRAEDLDLGGAFRHLGWRGDVPSIMSACDWFILPHVEQPMEGFGLAIVEAQLAGLRLVLSNGIADDPLLPSARSVRLPLSAGATAWAHAAAALLDGPPPSPASARAALRDSPMDMDRALDALLGLYA